MNTLMTSDPVGTSNKITAPPGERGPRLHLKYIDGLRALAALYVLVLHFIPRSYATQPPQGLLKLLAKVLSQGHFAVSVFIVISGFCLMLPVVRNQMTFPGGVWLYIKKRATRILPPYYAAVVLSVVVLLLLRHFDATSEYQDKPFTLRMALSHFFLLHRYIFDGQLPNNGPLWSIAVEWWIYFLFPLILIAWRRWGAITTTVAVSLTSYAIAIVVSFESVRRVFPFYVGNTTTEYVALFTMGALGAAIAFGRDATLLPLRDKVRWSWIALSCFVFVGIIGVVLGQQRLVSLFLYLDLVVGIGAMALLVAGVTHKATSPSRFVFSFLSSPPLVWVGAFSYSLYLIHYPLEDALVAALPPQLKSSPNIMAATLFFIGVPLLIGIGYLFYRFFEEPSVRLTKWVDTQAKAAVSIKTL